MGRVRLHLLLLGLVAGAAALQESAKNLVVPDTVASLQWQHLCKEKLSSGKSHTLRLDGVSDAGASFTATYRLLSCKNTALWSAKLEVTDCEGCDAEALHSEVEGLTVAFDQAGESFDRLHTSKNGRASPPMSEAARAVCAAAARAIAKRHASEEVELRTSRRLLQAMTITPDQSVRTCDSGKVFDFTVMVTKVSPGLTSDPQLQSTLPAGVVMSAGNATNGVRQFNFTHVPVGKWPLTFWAPLSGGTNVTATATLTVTLTGLTMEDFISTVASTFYVDAGGLPSPTAPLYKDVYVVMSEFMTPADVKQLNGSGGVPLADPSCLLVENVGQDLHYRCRIEAPDQMFFFGAFNEQSCQVYSHVLTKEVGLALALAAPLNAAPNGSLCSAAETWDFNNVAFAVANPRSLPVGPSDITSNFTGCAADPLDLFKMKCKIPAGTTIVEFKLTYHGAERDFYATTVQAFMVNGKDASIKVTAADGASKRIAKALAAGVMNTTVTIKVEVGKDVAAGELAAPTTPDNCTLSGAGVVTPAGTTVYTYSCFVAANTLNSAAFTVTSAAILSAIHNPSMCTNTDSVEILTYVTGQYPLTFQLNPLAAGYNYTICDSRTERVAVTFTPQFTTTTSPDSLITQITKADLSASNPDCTPMDGPLRWMCSFGPEASTHFSTFMVTKDGVTLMDNATVYTNDRKVWIDAYTGDGAARADNETMLLQAVTNRTSAIVNVQVGAGVSFWNISDDSALCVKMSNATVGGVAQYNCTNLAPSLSTPTSVKFTATDMAGLCSINDTYVFDLGVDQGYSLTVNPTYEINQCTAGATGSALIPVIIKHGGQITSKADIASKIAFEGPAGMCALQRYSGLLSAVPMTVNWLCQGLPAGTYNLKWTFNQNLNDIVAASIIKVNSYQYALDVSSDTPIVVVPTGATGATTVKVALGQGLNYTDVVVSPPLCAMSGMDGASFVYTCSALPAGKTTVTFAIAKQACPLSKTIDLTVQSADSFDTPPTIDVCRGCKACISDMVAWIQSAILPAHMAIHIGPKFIAACSATRDPTACAIAARSIYSTADGNFGRRPAALCYALDECQQGMGCQVSGVNATSGVTYTAALDACTANGISMGAPVPAPMAVQALGDCSSDSDCAKINHTGVFRTSDYCSFEATLGTQNKTCSCDSSTGYDSCKLRGMCADACSQPAVVRRMARQNALLTLCNTSAPNTCAAGQACMPFASNPDLASKCFSISCANGTEMVAPCANTGACVEADALVDYVQFTNDRDGLIVMLNGPVKPAKFSCDKVFDAATTQLLGGSMAWCVAGMVPGQPKQMLVYLPPTATIMPNSANSTVMIPSTQTVLLHALTGAAFRTNVSKSVLEAAAPSLPVAIITAPLSVAAPCPGAMAADVVVDASMSYDTSGRPLKAVNWRYGAGSPTSPVITASMAALNNVSDVSAKMRLVIAAANVSHIAPANYIITVEVTNFRDSLVPKDATLKVQAAGKAPVISIVGGNAAPRAFMVADGLKVATSLLADSVCAGSAVDYTWSGFSNGGSNMVSGYKLKDLVLSPMDLAAVTDSTTRTVTLTAKVVGQDASAVTASVDVVPVMAQVTAVVEGPNDFPATADIVISAKKSFDPSDVMSINPMNYQWSCERANGAPCFAAGRGNVAGPVWMIPAGTLTTDVSHTFTVTVVTQDGRTATATLEDVRPRPAGTPVAPLKRACGGACPDMHPASSPLIINAAIPAELAAATIAWTLDGAAFPGAGASLSVPASRLAQAGDVLEVAVALTLNGMTGVSKVMVPIDHAPYCLAGACLSVDGPAAAFPDAVVAATVPLDALADIDGAISDLTYTWGVRGTGGAPDVVIASGGDNTHRFTELPIGASKIFVRIEDRWGAGFEREAAVAVAAPGAGFDGAAALAMLDPAQAVRTGDPAAVAALARKVALVSAYGPASNATASDRTAFKATVDSRVAALLAAGAGGLNAKDTWSGLSAAAGAMAASGALTNKTDSVKASMLAMSKGVSDSAKLNGAPIPSDSATPLLVLNQKGEPKAVLPDDAWRAATTQVAIDVVAQKAAASLMRGLVDANTNVAALIAAGVAPGDGVKQAGDNGVYVAVANQPASALASFDVPTSDAKVSFSGPFVGPCAGVDATGKGTTAPCAAGPVTVTTQYYKDSSLFTNVRTSTNIGIITTSGLSTTVPTGAVIVAVSGQDPATGAFPCAAAGGCKATVTLPMPAPAAASRRLLADPAVEYTCVRMSSNTVFAAEPGTVAAVDATTTPSTASCTVTRGGTYMVASTPLTAPPGEDPAANQASEIVFQAPANTRALLYNFRFVGADYVSMVASTPAATAMRQQFRADVADAVAAATGLPRASVQLGLLTQGSIRVPITLHYPSDWPASKVAELNALITSNPGALFNAAFLATYGITGVEASLDASTPLPTGGWAGLTPGAQAGIAIGVIVFVAMLAGGGYFVYRRKQRMAARAPAAFDNAYAPPQTA